MRGKRLLTVLVAVFVLGCGGPDAAHYEAVLDELSIPASWELARTVVNAPGGLEDCVPGFGPCPSVFRYYLVAGDPIDAYPEAKQMVVAAGFSIDPEYYPQCEGGGMPACAFVAVRDSDALTVGLFDPGRDPEALGIAKEGFSLIRIIADQKRESQ